MRKENIIVSYDEAKKYQVNKQHAGLKQGEMEVEVFYNEDGSIDEERTYRPEYRSNKSSSVSKDDKDAAKDRKKMKKENKKGGSGICCSIVIVIGSAVAGYFGLK